MGCFILYFLCVTGKKTHSELGEIIDIYRNRGDCIQIAIFAIKNWFYNLPSWKQLITYILLKKS